MITIAVTSSISSSESSEVTALVTSNQIDNENEKKRITSIVITNPVIEGLEDGCGVVGDMVGDVEGMTVGVDVMNMGFKLISHCSLKRFSNSSIEASISSAFVASTINWTSA